MRRFVTHLILPLLSIASLIKCEEGAQYLQNAIRDLHSLKDHRQTLRRVDTNNGRVQSIITEPTQSSERRIQSTTKLNNIPPPLSLTKGELAALYQAAISKGETIQLNTGGGKGSANGGGAGYVHAAVHELDASPSYIHEEKAPSTPHLESADDGGADGGYYYYYYPVKSFLDQVSSHSAGDEHHYSSASNHPEIVHGSTDKPHFQYHSHTHQHNVKITSTKEMQPEKSKKALEPLFMAISGFVGMALMFVLSVIVFPKFGIKKKANLFGAVKKNERITNIARVALEAIDGKDCIERFACELEKTARTFQIQDNRFVKLLKRMAPNSLTKQMDRMGKFTNKKLRCTAIPCKKKNNNHNDQMKKKVNSGQHKKS